MAKQPVAHKAHTESVWDDQRGEYVERSVTSGPPIALVTITKVVREEIPLNDGGGQSFGQTLDQLIMEAARDGQEFQSVTFSFTSEQWKDLI